MLSSASPALRLNSSSARHVSRTASAASAAPSARPGAASSRRSSRRSALTTAPSAPAETTTRSRYHDSSASSPARSSSRSAPRCARRTRCSASRAGRSRPSTIACSRSFACSALAAAAASAEQAKEREQAIVDGLDLPARDAEQRVRRAQRGAERDELLAGLEALESWYRDLVVVSAGAEGAVVNADRLDDLRDDAAPGLAEGAADAAEAVRETWRALEEFNLNAGLALESMFVRVSRSLPAPIHAAG